MADVYELEAMDGVRMTWVRVRAPAPGGARAQLGA